MSDDPEARTTCHMCGTENVEVGWAGVCRNCWDVAVEHDAECPLGSDCDDTLCEYWNTDQ